MAKSKRFWVSGLVLAVAIVTLAIFMLPGQSFRPFYKEVNGFALDQNQQHNIDLKSIVNDGSGRDGVLPISQPKFVPIQDAPTSDDTPGIIAKNGGEQHFYPYNIIAWHEIVNDYLGATPTAVVYSPKCNSAAAYKRLANDESIWFGMSGLSFNSDALLYDYATNSLWLQKTGRAVVGPRTGLEMERIETEVLTWAEAKQKYPTAVSLGTETGFDRDYKAANYPGKSQIAISGDVCN